MPQTPNASVFRPQDLVALLSPTLGEHKSVELVSVASTQLGYNVGQLSRGQALCVLDRIAQVEGLVGIVARLAKARLRLESRFPASCPT